MQTRRHFLASVPAFAALGALSKPAFADTVPASDAELQHQMLGKLTTELNDPSIANTETGYLFNVFFSWTPPSVDVGQIRAIVAYSFGNAPSTAGAGAMPAPGPVNEQIADTVFQLHQQTSAPIYAQWEVANVLASKYRLSAAVTSVAPPVVAANGTVTVPMPDVVAAAVVKQAGSAAALGTVGVVTHRDQASLAVQLSNAAGMNSAVPAGLTLPSLYDATALQPANRRRDLYLLSNLSAQLAALRLTLINQQYPNG
ncbi:Tat pathway signal protein [Burkholderia sp. Ac-20353]|uniref:Tat pathway signal protein n=1 Tax=Burkholderia sp. Ac-20353 TaxID=2703894 RepID=UPI00197C4696|nr:Tat pathway signal protein [Burkholderia sp. Ac-20353]MBN3791156.1 Tat pathway signal protein [Burkholderia sp. Ac-20353]